MSLQLRYLSFRNPFPTEIVNLFDQGPYLQTLIYTYQHLVRTFWCPQQIFEEYIDSLGVP